jgi:DNA-binding MarR family transcriptional regulator
VATKRTNKERQDEASDFAKQLGKRFAFDVVEEEIFVCMLRTIDLISAQTTDLFAKHQISGPLYNALRIVGGETKFNGEGVPLGTIAARLICRNPDTTRLVNRLEDLDYVQCVACPKDARRRMVKITDQGSRVLKDLHRPIRDLHRKNFGALNSQEQDQLLGLLEKLRTSLSDTQH